MQTLHVFTVAEHHWSFVRVVATDPFKHGGAVVQRVGHHVNFRVFPANHLTIEPNVISFFCRHFFVLSRLSADLL
ncbi:Uncharacterised protein [Klebsiella pneumoniae]|nr:Uncharacterised protein [Klebsiella pneumoniae]